MADEKKETIAMIRSRLAEIPTPEELLRWSLDARLGVRQALQQYARRQDKVRKEHERLRALYRYEEHWYAQGKLNIAGTDEAGRGPVAGPVTVAAVILPPHAMLDGLNDSKKLSAVTREKLFKEIIETAIAYKILHIPVEVIDSVNIYQAVLDGMQAATMSLQPAAQVLLADAMPVALPIPVQAIIRGDSQSASIAAASILAKVSRDHLMEELDIQYPQYGFAAHKGYLTEHHLSMLKKYGPSPVHRKSFEPIKSMINAF